MNHRERTGAGSVPGLLYSWSALVWSVPAPSAPAPPGLLESPNNQKTKKPGGCIYLRISPEPERRRRRSFVFANSNRKAPSAFTWGLFLFPGYNRFCFNLAVESKAGASAWGLASIGGIGHFIIEFQKLFPNLFKLLHGTE